MINTIKDVDNMTTIWCRACTGYFIADVDKFYHCPYCGQHVTDVLSGEGEGFSEASLISGPRESLTPLIQKRFPQDC